MSITFSSFTNQLEHIYMDINSILFHQQQNVDLTLPRFANDLETIKIVMRRIETKQSIEVNNLIQLKGV